MSKKTAKRSKSKQSLLSIHRGWKYFAAFAISTALALSPSHAWAAGNPAPFIHLPGAPKPAFLPNPTQALDSLRQAHETIHSNPVIRQILSNTQRALSIAQRITGAEIETTKFQDYYKGLEVIGSMAFHHKGRLGTELQNTLARFDLNTDATVTADEAVRLAQSLTEFSAGSANLLAYPELKILPTEDNDSARLVYWVKLKGESLQPGSDVVIDAHDGSVIAEIPHHLTIAPVEVFQATATCQSLDPESGAPESLQIKACKHTVSKGVVSRSADSSARQAAANASKTLQYFLTKHGRDSYDNKGSASVNIVHVGHKFDNAFWDSEGKIMAYGDGDGVETGDFTRAVDVAGHEMTHGVVSQTANLIYSGESGALNEAYADFFGKMIANDGDWALGRNLYLDTKNSKGFRDLSNPTSLTVRYLNDEGKMAEKPYPAHMRDRFVTKSQCGRRNDNCWVHINSTIPSHAAYLVFKAIGKEKTEKLYYATLTQFLNPRSNFRMARNATLMACGQMFDATTCRKVQQSFAKVGL